MQPLIKPHLLWMAFLFGLVAWGSWFFRFSHDTDLIYLDRWTWSVVAPNLQTGSISKRASLTAGPPKAAEFLRGAEINPGRIPANDAATGE